MYKITLDVIIEPGERLHDVANALCVDIPRPVHKIDVITINDDGRATFTFYSITRAALVGVIMNYMGENDDPHDMGKLVGMIEPSGD